MLEVWSLGPWTHFPGSLLSSNALNQMGQTDPPWPKGSRADTQLVPHTMGEAGSWFLSD